jgi:hypothetical protein
MLALDLVEQLRRLLVVTGFQVVHRLIVQLVNRPLDIWLLARAARSTEQQHTAEKRGRSERATTAVTGMRVHHRRLAISSVERRAGL